MKKLVKMTFIQQFFILLLLIATLFACSHSPKIITLKVNKSTPWKELKTLSNKIVHANDLGERDSIYFLSQAGDLLAFYRKSVFHLITNRSLTNLLKYYPEEDFDKNKLENKLILDLGCGSDGNFVQDLRGKGYNAHGIDLHINQEDKEKRSYLFQGDVTNMPFKENSYDVFFSSFLFFKPLGKSMAKRGKHYKKYNLNFIRKSFKEIIRVSKKNAQLIIAPIYEVSRQEIEKMLIGFDELRIESYKKIEFAPGNFSNRLILRINQKVEGENYKKIGI